MNKLDLSRRSALTMLAGTALPSAIGAQVNTGGASQLLLLGTGGGPVLGGERSMTASVILAGGRAYLIDCGYGTAGRLAKANLPVSRIDSIFITHNHADHVLDYGAILFFAWLQGRARPIDVHGPPPLAAMTRDVLAANAIPLDYYRTDMGMAAMPEVRVREQVTGGPVMDDGVARVTCCLVKHPPVTPAFAYRFDLPDRSVVFSGDTAPSDALIALARGADVLVHEAAEVELVLSMMRAAAQHAAPQSGTTQPRSYDPDKFRQHVLQAHSSAEDAGRVAAAAGVGTLVLSHLSPGESKLAPDSLWAADAGKHFRGRIVVGHDGLML